MLLLCEFHLIYKRLKILHRHGGHLINIFVRNRYCEGFRFQTLSMAGFTRRDAHKLFILCFHRLRGSLTVSSLHIADQTVKCDIIHALTALSFIAYFQFFSVCSIDQNIFYLIRIFPERCIQ